VGVARQHERTGTPRQRRSLVTSQALALRRAFTLAT
jgi:hypothetical protein